VYSPQLISWQAALDDFREGRDTPRLFLERCIERLYQVEPELRAFVTLALPRSRIAADAATLRWKAGQPRSLIDGMPIGIKDVIETFDMPTQMGSPVMAGWHSRRDAAAVLALREAGAVILGKTKTTEFAGLASIDTCNPHDSGRTSGGSSAGSAAAVGAGIVPMALGTQVLGSILRPASFCGAFGYKPTLGAINRGGSHDFQSHSCVGAIGASLEDLWCTVHALVARAGGDPGAQGLVGDAPPAAPVQPTRLALHHTPGWALASEGARAQLEQVLADCARAGVTILTRDNDHELAQFEADSADIRELGTGIFTWESRWFWKSAAAQDPEGLGTGARDAVTRAEALGLDGYRALLEQRARLRASFEALATRVDAFITLAAPGAAPQGHLSTGDPIFNASASVLGTPALALPILQDEGLPLGLQLIGAQHSDARLFATAGWFVGRFVRTSGA